MKILCMWANIFFQIFVVHQKIPVIDLNLHKKLKNQKKQEFWNFLKKVFEKFRWLLC